MSELLPCPFCAGTKGRPKLDEIAEDHGGGWRVGCYGCGVFTAIPMTKEKAVSTWNTRPPSPLPADVEGLVKRLGSSAEYFDGFVEDIDARKCIPWAAFADVSCLLSEAAAMIQRLSVAGDDVERVAEVLWLDKWSIGPQDQAVGIKWDAVGEDAKTKYRRTARAAIAAMKGR